jgi:hypothetical protein
VRLDDLASAFRDLGRGVLHAITGNGTIDFVPTSLSRAVG